MEESSSELSLREVEALDELADAFEQAFADNTPPSIDDFLAQSALPRRIVLRELLRIDHEMRNKLGLSTDLDDYLRRYPSDSSVVFSALRKQPREGSPQSIEHVEEETPEKIGRYTVRRKLGSGGFGIVYLALDTQLDRLVAIKVPKIPSLDSVEQVESFLREASSAAKLSHPALVSVYDVQVESGQPYIVYEYVQGESLASWAARQQLSFQQIVKLFVIISDALRHAHGHGVIHCDLKLSNILIDSDANPRIADFGLAIHEHSIEQEYQVSGTPVTMAPEQIRGELHHVDPRTDIWAVGVMLYELLLGRRPFHGDSRSELYERIQHAAPDQPTLVDPSLPLDLERICMKCVEKRRADRFQSAEELRVDLELWLRESQLGQVPHHSLTNPGAPLEPISASAIIPRGLRAFSSNDSPFFASLLPGPRDRSGVPESIAFWKRKIEAANTDDSFSVGLIYGPSGSGKSSLVQAGILPSLDLEQLLVISLDASVSATESMIQKRVTMSFPELSDEDTLPKMLGELRSSKSDRQVLIIIDQFEQWLQVERDYSQAELVDAFRQCDTVQLRVLLVVRDDFFASVNLLFQELELPLREGQNYALVPRFSLQHAEHVLSRFGLAYGGLPSELDQDQRAFVTRAVQQLSELGSVVSVRLALFAEMMKNRAWITSSLEEFGGTDGIGVAYLEDAISGQSAGPTVRTFEAPIRRILEVLLPPLNCDIRSTIQSEGQLRAVAECDSDEDWQTVVNVLDQDLRLITPVDPIRGSAKERSGDAPSRSYQLTHDYLVPSLRTWLTRKQRETRRGRAALKLAELSEMWKSRPDTRFLPNVYEWAECRLLTSRRHWTAAEREVMARAGQRHFRQLVMLGLILACVAFMTWRVAKARSDNVRLAVDRIATADFKDIARIIDDSGISWQRLRPAISERARAQTWDSLSRLKLEMAFATREPERIEPILPRLLELAPRDLESLFKLVSIDNPDRIEDLWKILDFESAFSTSPSHARKLLAASSLLSRFGNSKDPRWQASAKTIAMSILNLGVENNRDWARLHREVKGHLSAYFDEVRLEARRVPYSPETARKYENSQSYLAAEILLEFADDNLERIAELLFTSTPKQFAGTFSKFAERPTEALKLVRNELARVPVPEWNDNDASEFETVPAHLVTQVEEAEGMLAKEFAYCQRLPFGEFATLAESLRAFGYRPLKVKPYPNRNGELLTAATWTRDQKDWRFESELVLGNVEKVNAEAQADALVPVDLSGYLIEKPAGTPSEGEDRRRFCAVFSEPDSQLDNIKLYAGTAEVDQWRTEFRSAYGVTRDALALHCYLNAEGKREYCGILAKSGQSSTTFKVQSSSELEQQEDWSRILTEISVVPLTEREDPKQFYSRVVSEWQDEDFQQDTVNARNKDILLAQAHFHLGDYDQAEYRCQQAIDRVPQFASAYRWRSRIHAIWAATEDEEARAKYRKQVEEDLARFARLNWPPVKTLGVSATTMAYFGEHEAYLAQLEELLGAHQQAPDVLYQAARGYAGCATALNFLDQEKHSVEIDEIVSRALKLLGQAIEVGFQDGVRISRDSDWSLFAGKPEFEKLLSQTAPPVVYCGTRRTSRGMDSVELHGLVAEEHQARCRELAGEGYRPVSMSLASTKQGTICASVWHRPRPVGLEGLALRQANAAVAAYRLGSPADVWPLLEGSPDTRRRTALIHSLGPAECEPQLLVERLYADSNSKQRIGLVQSLGEFTLTQSQQESIAKELVKWFRDDIDAGVHSSCEWLLKKWGYTQEIDAIHKELATGKREGDRRWYRCKSNEFTFAIIDGPVEFLRGTPRYTQGVDKAWLEPQNRVRIRRSYAIATTEVSVKQMEALYYATRVVAPADPIYYPSKDCAAGEVEWKLAALYCMYRCSIENMEGKQWCYTFLSDDDEPACVAKDYLNRTGYRLPTLSEWEYAARGGTATNRHFGDSHHYMNQYAWFSLNSQQRMHPVGSLKPNDFGLFDTLGNATEWLMEYKQSTYAIGPIGDDIEPMEPTPQAGENAMRGKDQSLGDFADTLTVDLSRNMQQRGFACTSLTSSLRSSKQASERPMRGLRSFGFRLAHTMPKEE